MKIKILVLILIINSFLLAKFYKKDGVFYDSKTNRPYTGRYEEYYKKRLISKRIYIKGLPEGKQQFFYGNGKLRLEEIYKNRKLIKKIYYSKKGIKISEEYFKNGNKTKHINYEGELKGVTLFKKGVASPTYYYYKGKLFNGKKILPSTRRRNKSIWYFENGRRIKKVNFLGELREENDYTKDEASKVVKYFKGDFYPFFTIIYLFNELSIFINLF